MATSETAIANSALMKLGAERILSLNDDTREARILKEQYEKVRDDLLRSHPWNFAIERVTLAALTTTPAFGFTYEYQVPADCLRILETDTGNEGEEWQKEGDKIRSDVAPMSIKYVKKVTDPNLFDANFAEVLAIKLASDVCYAITQSTTLKAALLDEYKAKIREARSFDGQEGGTRQVYARQWLNSRY